MVTRGAVHRVTAAKLTEAAAIWEARLAHLPHPRVAVLIGGGNGSYGLSPQRMASIAASLSALARDGAGLMVTPSRRTGREAERILREALTGLGWSSREVDEALAAAGREVEAAAAVGDEPDVAALLRSSLQRLSRV